MTTDAAIPSFVFSDAKGCADVDPEIFFDDDRRSEAKRICSACPFALECAEYGKVAQYGIFGGKTPNGRGWGQGSNLASERAERDAAIVAMYDEGHGTAAIARAFNLAQNTVRTALIRGGRRDESRSRASMAERREALRAMAAEGLSHAEIGERLGIRPHSVYNALVRLGHAS